MDGLRKLDLDCAVAMGDEIKTASSVLDGAPIGLRRYSTDPTAARILEDEIERRGLSHVYVVRLAEQVGIHRSSWEYKDTLLAIPWLLLRATPEQRARAFLEAVRDG